MTASELPPEFALIARHFRSLAGPGALDLLDDAAVLTPPPGRELVVAADAMVQGVHFLPDDPPDLVGRKLLRTNLSDLAAMAAAPLGYLMTVTASRVTPDAWFAGFAAGLARDQGEFGIALLGGDTTSTSGPICLSLTVLGTVAPGCAVRRVGARPGHGLWVSGSIGDGALVRTEITGRGDPIQLDYRLEKTPGEGAGWKIYNLNVLGVWLVETYRGQFASEINARGVDGLIQALVSRNKSNAAKG